MFGFPLLIKHGVHFDEVTETVDIVNGASEEIIEKINEWYPGQILTESEKSEIARCEENHYDWSYCSNCGFGKDNPYIKHS